MSIPKKSIPSALVGVALLASNSNIKWPSLPKKNFISGRPATEQDVKSGKAVFVLKDDQGKDPLGIPIPIKIPQYAFHLEKGKRTPVLVIQAEQVGGKKYIGARNLTGNYLAGFLFEFELLGVQPPSK